MMLRALLALMAILFLSPAEARGPRQLPRLAMLDLSDVRRDAVTSFGEHKNRKKNVELALTDTFSITVVTKFGLPSGHVLHWMAPDGCDHNTGTARTGGDTGTCSGSAGQTGPWASANQSLSCGDVLLMKAGTYSNSKNSMRVTTNASTCPSPNDGVGGIDLTGGINAAIILCEGPDLNSCIINCDAGSPCNPNPGFGPPVGVSIAANNWAIEGVTVNGNSNVNNLAFQAEGCTSNTVTHYAYFINVAGYNTGQAFTPMDCTVGTAGADYVRIVGMIAENAVLYTGGSAVCIGAIDVVSPGKFGSSTTDVKYFVYNSFSWNNIQTLCDHTVPNQADGEDFMFDSLDNRPTLTGKYIMANNIGFWAERACINNFSGNLTSNTTFREYNNTCFDNAQRGNVTGENNGEEIYVNQVGGSTVQIFSNIAYSPFTTNQSGKPVYALSNNGGTGTVTIGGTGQENIFDGNATTCTDGGPGTCQPSSPPNIIFAATGASFGTNILANPNFQDTADLIANHLTAPTLTGCALTTQCMGWNWLTQTATTNSFIYDLTPTGTCGSISCSARGFQPPGPGCLSSGDVFNDWPSDMKGLVTLQYDSTNNRVIQVAGLANVPCGM